MRPAITCLGHAHFVPSKSETSLNSLREFIRLFAPGRDGEHRRPPRTLADALDSQTAHKRHDVSHHCTRINAALHRSEHLARARIEIVQALAECLQVVFA